MASPVPRLLKSNTTPSSPPAIWAAFARQGAWKNWVLAGQFAVIFFLVVACMGFAHRAPDVVLVAPDGKSTYLSHEVASEALLRFLAEQRQQPSDVTVVHFTKDFLQTFLAANSSTIELAWPQSLSMMTPSLRSRMSQQAAKSKLVETLKLAQVTTDLTIEKLDLVERLEKAMHVRAVVLRHKRSLTTGAEESTDRLTVDVVELVVPRSPATPDGLQVAEYSNTVVAPSSPSSPESAPHAP